MSDEDPIFPDSPPDHDDGALELDPIDDPAKTLKQALQAGDEQRVRSALRLLSASGRPYSLAPVEALRLAELLEADGRFEDAARACRHAAEAEPEGPHAAPAMFHGAVLLLGPAGRPEIGQQMLTYLVEHFPEHTLRPKAEEGLLAIEAGLPWPPDDLLGVSAEKDGEAVSDALSAPPSFGEPGAMGEGEPVSPGVGSSDLARVEAWAVVVFGGPGTARYRVLSMAFKVVFALVALGTLYTWWTYDDFHSVEDIRPALFADPVMKPIKDGEPIRFERGGVKYAALPLAEYSIAGLAVSTKRHSLLEIESAQIMDVCMMWGGNLQRRVHQDPGLTFSNHISTTFRYCRSEWTRSAARRFDRRRLSNNHLFVADDEREDQALRITAGDQVRIRGKLVYVHLITRLDADNSKWFPMKSNLDPLDGHHCEVILVEQVDILAPGNPEIRRAKAILLWVLAGLILVIVLRFIFLPVTGQLGPRSV